MKHYSVLLGFFIYRNIIAGEECMTEKELMIMGQLYNANDLEIERDFKRAKRLLRMINNTTEDEWEYRIRLFHDLFKHVGDDLWIEIPFQCDFGYNISVGRNFYANYDCIIIDAGDVIIGNDVFLGPRVCIYTAGHPVDAEVRNKQLEFGKKVCIGNSVWIGGNSVINPGVVIGDNVVIGSGSIVTKDIPSGVVAAGNPCKVIRMITDDDKKYWEIELKSYLENRGFDLKCKA